MNTNEELKTRPEHDCEFFLTTDVCVHSCECENITVSDSSLSVEYIPLKKYQVLQSENSEITLSIQVANQGLDILYGENEELKSENQKLRDLLKDAHETLIIASLIDKSNTCRDSAARIDAFLKTKTNP